MHDTSGGCLTTNLCTTMTTAFPLKSIIAPSLLSADLANLDKDAQQMMDMYVLM
jgi:hypothetical protein